MPRKAQRKYGPNGEYYRKLIKGADGKYVPVYGKTLAELSEKVTLKQNELAAASDLPPAELYVFEYAAGFYARRAPHLSEERRKLYQYQINKVICPVIGGKPIKDVTPDDLEAVLATRAHLSRRTQKDTVQILKQIFDAAADSGACPRDPSRKLKPHGKPPKKKQALTEQQQEQLLEAVHGLKVEPFVMLGLYTGMRRSEICGLRWDCVDLNEKTPHVVVRRACRWPEKNKPKISEELKSEAAARTIPIPPQLVQYLQELKDAAPGTDAKKKLRYVYCNADGSPVSYSTFRRRWETIKTRSTASGRELGTQIPKHKIAVTLDFSPSPHILRHTYITRLVLGEMDLKRVQYLAGHEDPALTLQIYTSLQKNAPEDLIDDIWEIFDAADGDE